MKKNIGTKLLVSALLILLTITSYGQGNTKPNLSLGESFYLLKYGIGDTYKWDNMDVNNQINLSLKNRKTSNALLYGGAGISAIAIILEFFVYHAGNGFNLNRFSTPEEIIPTSLFVGGGLIAGAGGIIRLDNHKKLKLAKSKLNLR